MNPGPFDVEAVLALAHSPLRNYVIPGLTSWLITEPSDKGVIRLFTCERAWPQVIAPHSHRFDFRCFVLRGSVVNTLWMGAPTGTPESQKDIFQATVLSYDGAPGKYKRQPFSTPTEYRAYNHNHHAGSWYGMTAEQIHSITFSKDAVVLFFEGPPRLATSLVLEPVVDGEVIPLAKTEPWMFRREEAPKP